MRIAQSHEISNTFIDYNKALNFIKMKKEESRRVNNLLRPQPACGKLFENDIIRAALHLPSCF